MESLLYVKLALHQVMTGTVVRSAAGERAQRTAATGER